MVIKGSKKSWTVLTVMNDVKERLDKLKEKKEHELKMKLSWSKFLQFVMNDLEQHSGNGKGK